MLHLKQIRACHAALIGTTHGGEMKLNKCASNWWKPFKVELVGIQPSPLKRISPLILKRVQFTVEMFFLSLHAIRWLEICAKKWKILKARKTGENIQRYTLTNALFGWWAWLFRGARFSRTGKLGIGMGRCCYMSIKFANLYRDIAFFFLFFFILFLVLETANTHRTLWVIVNNQKRKYNNSQIRIQSK